LSVSETAFHVSPLAFDHSWKSMGEGQEWVDPRGWKKKLVPWALLGRSRPPRGGGIPSTTRNPQRGALLSPVTGVPRKKYHPHSQASGGFARPTVAAAGGAPGGRGRQGGPGRRGRRSGAPPGATVGEGEGQGLGEKRSRGGGVRPDPLCSSERGGGGLKGLRGPRHGVWRSLRNVISTSALFWALVDGAPYHAQPSRALESRDAGGGHNGRRSWGLRRSLIQGNALGPPATKPKKISWLPVWSN